MRIRSFPAGRDTLWAMGEKKSPPPELAPTIAGPPSEGDTLPEHHDRAGSRGREIAEPSGTLPPDERYERVSLLGAGGMGEVHLCHDRRIGRDVALKILRTEIGTSSRAAARFGREALVQARLEHPAIVPSTTSRSIAAARRGSR